MNVFILSNYTKIPLRHIVWPGICVFPDWFNPNTTIFWKMGLKELNSIINFDGIWHDMNEPGTLWSTAPIGAGEVNFTNIPENNIYENIPYIPGNGFSDLNTHSISVNAKNFGEDQFMTIYNTKSMTSFLQAKSTFEHFLSKKKRPFILSRANVLGSNRYSFHWLGDNDSSLNSMKMSVSGIMNYQMFGYSMVGSDICGFNNDSNDQLCSRWHVLGAFYPFSRNHNSIDAKDQEPFAIGSLTLSSAKKALSIRYSLIRYMYTKLFLISLNGGSFFKPLFFEFYDDMRTYENIENKFMFGDAFIYYPVYSENEDDIDAYIPNSNWNSFPSLDNLITYNPKSKGTDIKLSGKFDIIHLYLRGGYIIPKQETNFPVVLSTNQLRRIGTELIINPDQFFNSEGDIIFDDGYNNDYSENYLHIKMIFNYNQLLFNRVKEIREYNYNDIKLTKITYLRTDYLNRNLKAQIKDLKNNVYVSSCIYEGDKIIIDLNKFNITFMNVKNIYLIDKDFFEE
jgi:lysosomal alpha-glucosidase